MTPNAAWSEWKTRLEALFTYKPYRHAELTPVVDAFMAALRAAVYATATEAAHEAIAAHDAKGAP